MNMQDKQILGQGNLYYSRVWSNFIKSIKSGEHISLAEYCRTMQINYSSFRRWIYVKRLSVRNIKTNISVENRQKKDTFMSSQSTTCSNLFIQIHPKLQQTSNVNIMRGVSVTLTNGVYLTLQECTIEDLVNLVTICNGHISNQGGM